MDNYKDIDDFKIYISDMGIKKIIILSFLCFA